eukprot:3282267-Pleurochrysis_carterae.AAC.1
MGCADEAEKRMQQHVKTALGDKCSLMGTGFTKVTVAINNPTPLHVDGNNIGLSVLCAFDRWFALLVEDSVEGVVAVGPYGRILHGNLATTCGERLVIAAYTSSDVAKVKVVSLLCSSTSVGSVGQHPDAC